MSGSESRSCPVCENPESICQCPSYGGEALALDLVKKADEASDGKVTIRREDFLVLCERAYAWGQEASARAIGLRSDSREPVSDMLRDALRYRWLVNKRISGVGVPCLAAFSRRSQSLEQCQDSSNDIDAAIDREMEAYRG